ncbi:glycosyltransferase family 2 protein [Aeromicrobium fastidiosum]|uniref:Glycosyltransferase family 2 protein n=1 Tax=Aeromicrobium fastidiosum TaxID=52699 RepID=A0A641ARA0_9ACTN|nr:glycosyltransferase family 2 protein [Aeromicrobium fastidiosum]KAA1379733.1 glycosyltransferase family 2 protein [Aeromicrobium fastidiosum]MBP2389219.1 glycosyltransferase involved in cell wall biosynthesis [Aeromicrobium fastidiosum]
MFDEHVAPLATDLPASVTAVVPTHRRPERMREAVESIVAQTYRGDIEIIVVFDACEVELPQLALPAHRTLRGIRNDRVRGLAGARNSGILAASHEFVAFLDDDDVWMPGKLDAQMTVFERHPESGLVGSAMQVDDGRRRHDRLVPHAVVTHGDLVHDRIAGLHSSSFVFRREVLDEVGMIDEQLPGAHGEDYDVLLATSRHSVIRLVNTPLVSVRWSGESYFYGHWGPYAAGHIYLLDKHPELQADDYARSRISSQIGFALAADGSGRQARTWLRRSLRLQPLNVRAWLGLLISYRLLSARLVARVANLVGKGI